MTPGALFHEFYKFLDRDFPDGGNSSSGTGFHQDDMQEAFEAGYALGQSGEV